jgi:DNA-binding transcriptional MerR regulator
MLTIYEVALIFDVHPETVKQWCQLGRLKPCGTELNGEPLFHREDVILSYINRSVRASLTQ